MPLARLDVFGLRNLNHVQLELSPSINLFYGANGSGKTSLLEAVFILGRGRSFRSRLIPPVINTEAQHCTVYGVVQHREGSQTPLGVTRDRKGGGVFKVDGEAVSTASALAEALPLLLINQDGFNLLEGSPQHRRRFVDWGVFHVEHDYKHAIQRFQRVLKQRNSLLRHDRIDGTLLDTWNREFVEISTQVTSARERYLERLLPVLNEVIVRLSPGLDGVEFSLYSGWDRDHPLMEILQQDKRRDVQFKTTHHGPHRADLRIRYGKQQAGDMLSRGQLKIVAIAMLLAQGFLYRQVTGRHSIYLIDDLAAELDKAHRAVVAELLCELKAQAFITGVDRDTLLALWPNDGDPPKKMFHVEQGRVTETPLN